MKTALPILDTLNLAGKRVVLRFDGDVPVEDGKITDDTRLQGVLPTIHHCLRSGATLVLMAHRGRPEGKVVPELSNRIVARYLTDALGQSVELVEDLQHTTVKSPLAILENLRFHPGEEKNDPHFAKQLAAFGDVYINDAFAVSHRAHASIVGVPALLPHAAGIQLEKEVTELGVLVEQPDTPYVAVLGGAKASDKSPIIADLIDKVDGLVIGGLIAITYLAAMGNAIGAHEVEDEQVTLARQCIRQLQAAKVPFLVPTDYINQHGKIKTVRDLKGDELILDIGPESRQQFGQLINKANTIFWNGAMGKFEDAQFAQGTLAVGRAIADSGADIRIGAGGDTVAAIDQHHLANAFTFISTGGGATLEFIAGRKLPGIEALYK